MSKRELDLRYVVMRLLGEIEPTGDYGKDQERLENVKVLLKLVDELTYDLSSIEYRYRDDMFGSRDDISKYIRRWLKDTKEWLDEMSEGWEE